MKKYNKAGLGLHPGEQIVSAMILMPHGSTSVAAVGAIGASITAKLRKNDHGDLVTDSGLAATLPDEQVALCSTGQRVLAYSVSKMSGKPTAIVAEYKPGDIASIEVGKDKLGPTVVIAFTDGTGRLYETPMRNKNVAEFVAGLR